MAKVRVIILRVAGTNCDFETEWAFNLCGAYAERVHINRIIEKKKNFLIIKFLLFLVVFHMGMISVLVKSLQMK
jgi:phosphoribosylformylglycinamidine (FGAM) synthase-like amidotransferase family enzyme